MSYRSFNQDNGMLEDIDEVRQVGIKLAQLVIMLTKDTPLALLMPYGMRLDTLVYAVSAMAFLQPTSQAGYMRELAHVLGYPDEEIEQVIQTSGLSETLPDGHPEAPKPSAPTLDPNDPDVKSSAVLSRIAEQQQKQSAQEVERVELPTGLEDFLRSLMEGKEKES